MELRETKCKSFPSRSGKKREIQGSLITVEFGSKRTHFLHDPKRKSFMRQASLKKSKKFQSTNGHISVCDYSDVVSVSRRITTNRKPVLTLEAHRTDVENAERRVRTTEQAEREREMF